MTALGHSSRVPSRTHQLVGDLHERALRHALTSLPAGEPHGYLYDLLPQYPLRRGKGLRPVLCMATCAAYGGSYSDALPFAAALELLHNAFLIHDDIQDGSAVRRGGEALHCRHGTALALNAGDALAARANAIFLRAVRHARPRIGAALVDGWERMIDETVEGQAFDLGWERDRRDDLDVPDYLSMCGKKTAWYTTIQPLAIGALLGSGDLRRESETFRFGWYLGLLFQIANDLAGVRPDGGDVAEGKRTILVIHLLQALDGRKREKAIGIMSRPREERGPADVDWVRKQMGQVGSIDYARACVSDLALAARREADAVFGRLPPSDARELLLNSTSYVLEQHGLPVPAVSPGGSSVRLA
jgi:geranylgeranyl diphosphate synthase, type II